MLLGCVAVAAGAINALAGGGTLITFPTLLALGVPPITANVTNTVALCPGFMAGILAQLKDLSGQSRRFWVFLSASVIGGAKVISCSETISYPSRLNLLSEETSTMTS